MPSETDTGRRPGGRWDEVTQAVGQDGDAIAAGPGARDASTNDDFDQHPSYYDISMLKKPVWTPEVGVYFFLGGMSGGAYMLARLAERIGGDEYRSLTRVGTAVALAAALPCAPLLIKDLGDPKRFHHMLRVFKPHSPMSLGSWALTGYTAAAAVAGLREWVRARQDDAPLEGAAKVADGAAAVVAGCRRSPGTAGGGVHGRPAEYDRRADLGPQPLAGRAVQRRGRRLAARRRCAWPWKPRPTGADGAAGQALAKVEGAARVVEVVTLAGFLAAAGEFAAPLTQGAGGEALLGRRGRGGPRRS